MEIKKIKDSSIGLLEILANEANSEGYRFVQRTIDEWRNCIQGDSEICGLKKITSLNKIVKPLFRE